MPALRSKEVLHGSSHVPFQIRPGLSSSLRERLGHSFPRARHCICEMSLLPDSQALLRLQNALLRLPGAPGTAGFEQHPRRRRFFDGSLRLPHGSSSLPATCPLLSAHYPEWRTPDQGKPCPSRRAAVLVTRHRISPPGPNRPEQEAVDRCGPPPLRLPRLFRSLDKD